MSERRVVHKDGNLRGTSRGVGRRPIIDLGDTRSESLGEWLYNHRLGLIVVVAVFLLGGTVLATARYNVTPRPVEYIIEFVEDVPSVEEVERLKRQRDKLQEDIDRRMAAMQKVQNLQSNDASESAASSSTSYDSDMQQMMDKVASDMATNRGEYESGMRDVEGIGRGSGSGGSEGTGESGERGKFSGAVTVAYSFEDPVRHHRDLYVPAYKTKGGGIVVVDVWLDRNGTVTSARIQSSTNSELNAQALAAARHKRTLFKIDGSAPASHRGTITYTFVAQ
jgi:TonB family protein